MTEQDLTPAVHGTVQTPAENAFNVEQRIRSHVRDMRTKWIKLTQDLYVFHEDKLWADLGYSSFESWLAGPDIELDRRWVYDLISVWRELVVNRDVLPTQLEPIAVSKVREVLPAIRRGDVTLDQGLSDAEALGRRDLEQKYRGRTAKSPEPALEATTETQWAICHACGSRYAVKEHA